MKFLKVSWRGALEDHVTLVFTPNHHISGSLDIKVPLRGGLFLAQLVKNLPAMWETWVRPLGWEDPLE